MERIGELPEGAVSVTITHDGKAQGGLFGVPKEFSTGSIGYNFSGKTLIGGKVFQVSGNAVLVGSKQ